MLDTYTWCKYTCTAAYKPQSSKCAGSQSMFLRLYVPKVLCSEGSIFRRFYIPKVLSNDAQMEDKEKAWNKQVHYLTFDMKKHQSPRN